MKKCIRIIIFLLAIGIFQNKFIGSVEARSGCCSYHGGVCGCGCCDGSPLSSTCAPYYPECGGGYGGYQPPPSCPLMSTYNSVTERCECMSGYVASGNSCISADQACKNKYGYNSESDYGGNQCKCRYGYVWNNSMTSCIDQDQSCQNQYGYNSKATISGDKCECKYGYVWNSSGTRCVDPDEVCRDQFGNNTKATIRGDQCECNYGYTWNKSRNKCITKDAACQEINGLMSRSGLSGQCECLDGYEYNGSQCVRIKKEYVYVEPVVVKPTVVPTVKPKVVKKVEPTKIPEVTVAPTVTGVPSMEKMNEIENLKYQSLFSRFLEWLRGKN